MVGSRAGLWLLAAPAVFDVDIRSSAADVAHVGGAAIVVVAVVSVGEVVRAPAGWTCRWASPSVSALLAGGVLYVGSVVAAGLLAAALAAPRGTVRERYAGWQRRIV